MQYCNKIAFLTLIHKIEIKASEWHKVKTLKCIKNCIKILLWCQFPIAHVYFSVLLEFYWQHIEFFVFVVIYTSIFILKIKSNTLLSYWVIHKVIGVFKNNFSICNYFHNFIFKSVKIKTMFLRYVVGIVFKHHVNNLNSYHQ